MASLAPLLSFFFLSSLLVLSYERASALALEGKESGTFHRLVLLFSLIFMLAVQIFFMLSPDYLVSRQYFTVWAFLNSSDFNLESLR